MTEAPSRQKAPEQWLPALELLPSEAATDLIDLMTGVVDYDSAWDRLGTLIVSSPTLFDDPARRQRLTALAINSRSLSESLAEHPELLVGDQAGMSVTLQVRAALARIAGADLAGEIDLELATANFSEAMDEIVEGELAKARLAVSERHSAAPEIPFAVIAMGKWGAQELNYSSDIDLMFVHDAGDATAEEARLAAQALASRLISNLSSPTFEGPALVVDANLRPEGSLGPLSRSMDSHRRYYEEWAAAWELQALLKARHASGDSGLGSRFESLAAQIVWGTGLGPDSLRSIRLIKEETEQRSSSRDVKRARGGIRDIEFTVQLLQLVHGRLDPDLRARSTLHAIESLGRSGLVEEDDSDDLAASYRFLRDLEHRIQIWELRQTHDVPDNRISRDRIGRSLGLPPPYGESLIEELAAIRTTVRAIHERLYFRPILDALVGSPTARLDPADAGMRLQVLGFSDFPAAIRALTELTAGTSRRSRVMRQLLPLMLDWLSLSPDPDMGLAQLRLLLAHSRDHSPLVSLLHTNPLAGERLCRLLGSGALLGSLIDRIPEFVPRLADDARLNDIRDAGAATQRLLGLIESRPKLDDRIGTIRRFARRRTLRIAARDVLNEASTEATMRSLSDSADAVITGALTATGAGADFLVVAMGRWGGRELSYESDLDLMYIYRDDKDREASFAIAANLHRIVSEPSKHGDAYELDTDLRPEGRSGPIARSMDGYVRYYNQWAEPWELLALIKARPVGGDRDMAAELWSRLEPVLWRTELPQEMIYEIRAVKARIESERIPPDQDPDYHLKLGRGGLSDIEFLTQLLQLRHGGLDRSLRATNTISTLAALLHQDHFNESEHRALNEAYMFCNKVRLRLHLQLGRPADSLPTDPQALHKLAHSLGYDRSSSLRDEYRRVTRRARTVFESRFF